MEIKASEVDFQEEDSAFSSIHVENVFGAPIAHHHTAGVHWCAISFTYSHLPLSTESLSLYPLIAVVSIDAVADGVRAAVEEASTRQQQNTFSMSDLGITDEKRKALQGGGGGGGGNDKRRGGGGPGRGVCV